MKEKDKEDDIAAEVAALLNTPKNKKAPNNETMSAVRQVMAIVVRKKKDEWLGIQKSDIPIQPQVAWLAPIESSIRNVDPDNFISRTELDSHANMVVVGKHCVILDDMGKTYIVNAVR